MVHGWLHFFEISDWVENHIVQMRRTSLLVSFVAARTARLGFPVHVCLAARLERKLCSYSPAGVWLLRRKEQWQGKSGVLGSVGCPLFVPIRALAQQISKTTATHCNLTLHCNFCCLHSNYFKHGLTFFSKQFSHVLHGACLLSVSLALLSLR